MQILIKEVKIINFGLHRQTEIKFPEKPVLIFAGANGSGKTQILEAILLALGYQSNRIRQVGFRTFIGRWGDTAFIELKLSNPMHEEERFIKHSNEKISEEIDKDEFTISCELTRSGIKYAINGKKSIKGINVSQQIIREIAELAGINPSSKLAFTAEDTVSNFAKESDRKKLETLLEAVGKKSYYDKLEELNQQLKEIEKEIDPLEKTLFLKRANLESMEKALEAFKERNRLLERLNYLEVELAWAKALQVQSTANELRKSKEQRERYMETIEEKINQQKNVLEKLKETREAVKKSLSEYKKSLTEIQGEKRSLEISVERLYREGLEIVKRIKELEKIVAKQEQKDRNALNRELTELKLKLSTVERELSNLTRERKALESRIREKELEETRRQHSPKKQQLRMTGWERTLVRDSIRFQKALKEKGINGVIGPIIELVELVADDSWEPSVKQAIGRYLFAFIAGNRESYYKAKRIYDEIFGKERSPILVVRYNSKMGNRERKKVEGIEGYADEFLVGPKEVKDFLKEVVSIGLAYDHDDPNILTDIAEKNRISILTKSGLDYYERFGGFTRPPAPVVSSLGREFQERGSQDVEKFDEKRMLEERLSSLMRKIIDLSQEKSKILQRINQIEKDLSKDIDLITSKKELEQLKKRKQELEEEAEKHKEELEIYEQSANNLITKIDELEEELRDLEARIFEAERTIASLSGELKRITQEIKEISKSLEVLEWELEEKISLAKEAGEQPENVRVSHVIEEEMIKIKTHLENIIGAEVNEAEVEKLRAEVADLEKYLEERKIHMQGLIEDINARLNRWAEDISELTSFLSAKVTELLAPTGIGQVSIRVKKVADPSQAELSIIVKGAGRPPRKFESLSGGEKVVLVTAILLSLHLRSETSIHGIDEFSQRLDPKNTALAFRILWETAKKTMEEDRVIMPQFLIFLPGISSQVELNEELVEVFYVGKAVSREEQ